MWVKLSKDQEVNGKKRQAGDAVNVVKFMGERLIEQGLASQITKEQVPDGG